MALPATEDFAGSVGALTGNWTQVRPAAGDVNKDGSGKGKASAADDVIARWSADTPTNDQEAEVVVSGATADHYVGPAVRCAGSDATADAYVFLTSAGGVDLIANLYSVVDNSYTFLGVAPGAYAAGDIAKLRAVGATLSFWRNGIANGSLTDGSLASGQVGVAAYNTGNRMDDFVGNSYPAAGSGIPVAWLAET